MENVLVIAGFDPSGAAGVLRDVKTMERLNVRALAVVTAVTYQNVSRVYGFHTLSPEVIARQIDVLLEEFEVKYVKVGMVGEGAVAEAIADKIREYDLKAVVDPVIRASSGFKLVDDPSSLHSLLRVAEVITPNIPEAEILSGMKIKSREDVIRAGRKLEDMYGCTVIKGGHLEGEDFLFCGDMHSAKLERVGREVRGTGCAYSSALTAYLSRGYGIEEAFKNARLFIQREIERSEKVGDVFLLP